MRRWTKKDLTDRYRVKWVTIWRWQRDRGFPRGRRYGTKLTWDRAAIRRWENKEGQDQFVKGDPGVAPSYFGRKGEADVAA